MILAIVPKGDVALLLNPAKPFEPNGRGDFYKGSLTDLEFKGSSPSGLMQLSISRTTGRLEIVIRDSPMTIEGKCTTTQAGF